MRHRDSSGGRSNEQPGDGGEQGRVQVPVGKRALVAFRTSGGRRVRTGGSVSLGGGVRCRKEGAEVCRGVSCFLTTRRKPRGGGQRARLPVVRRAATPESSPTRLNQVRTCMCVFYADSVMRTAVALAFLVASASAFSPNAAVLSAQRRPTLAGTRPRTPASLPVCRPLHLALSPNAASFCRTIAPHLCPRRTLLTSIIISTSSAQGLRRGADANNPSALQCRSAQQPCL